MKKSLIFNDKLFVLTRGMGFSGAGFLNEWFIANGFSVNKGYSLNEIKTRSSNHFSWVDYLDGKYEDSRYRLLIGKRILLDLIYRILKFFFYYPFLDSILNKDFGIHVSHSRSFSVREQFNNFYPLLNRNDTNIVFRNWLVRKFKYINNETKLVLFDNGIPDDERLMKLLIKFIDPFFIVVFRDPIIQFVQSIVFYDKYKNKSITNIESKIAKFVTEQATKYQMYLEFESQFTSILFVELEKFRDDLSYRENIAKLVFVDRNLIDFESNSIINKSIENEQYLKSTSHYNNAINYKSMFNTIYKYQVLLSKVISNEIRY